MLDADDPFLRQIRSLKPKFVSYILHFLQSDTVLGIINPFL